MVFIMKKLIISLILISGTNGLLAMDLMTDDEFNEFMSGEQYAQTPNNELRELYPHILGEDETPEDFLAAYTQASNPSTFSSVSDPLVVAGTVTQATAADISVAADTLTIDNSLANDIIPESAVEFPADDSGLYQLSEQVTTDN